MKTTDQKLAHTKVSAGAVEVSLPVQQLRAEFAAGAADRSSRTVPVTFYTGATVLWFSWEDGLHELTLLTEPSNVKLGVLNSGRAPFTLGHADSNDPLATIGVISNARLERGKAKADVRFSTRPDVEPIFGDVIDGILPNVSVGARLLKLKETTKEGANIKSFEATLWEPFAIALVGLGADPGAHFAAAAGVQEKCTVELLGRATARKGEGMETTNEGVANGTSITLTAEEQADIRRRVQISRLPVSFANDLIARNIGQHEATEAIFNRLADIQEAVPTREHRTTADVAPGRELALRMAEALCCRYGGGAPSEAAREFVGSRVTDMAREICLASGLRPPRNAGAVIEMAMSSTSDFPYLLQQAGERQLMAAYTASESKLKAVSRRSTFSDFRTKATVRLGEAPKLLKVSENGSVTGGARAEAHESYRGYTYGRIFAITREALINDDLGAFTDFSRAWGIAASSVEADALVTLLTSNPAMSDTVALFHANHGNLASPGAAISDTTLGAARLALRTMKGLDGATIIEVAPKYLVVPAALETTAEKYLATLYPSGASSVNPFSGKLELIVEPRLDAASGTGWYLFGDPDLCPVMEYAYLNGAEGPQVSTQEGWSILGMEFRAILDFGAGVLDYRGAYKGNA